MLFFVGHATASSPTTAAGTGVRPSAWRVPLRDARGKRNSFARHTDRDLATECVRPPVLQELMSLAHSSERKGRADDRLHETSLDQSGERVQLSSVLSCEDEVIGGVPAPRLDEVLRLRDIDDTDNASEVGERQRASCERVATDRVEDDIDPPCLASSRPRHRRSLSK